MTLPYHKSYYEKNKLYLRAYQRAYYHRKKGNIFKPKNKLEKKITMTKTYGKVILYWI
tara:strand:+ start:268 stop:441 length:174 start_codon:yes stop_codon:yes gene_type:complete